MVYIQDPLNDGDGPSLSKALFGQGGETTVGILSCSLALCLPAEKLRTVRETRESNGTLLCSLQSKTSICNTWLKIMTNSLLQVVSWGTRIRIESECFGGVKSL